ncbi:MAG: DUF2067 family protein [Vulcanisaeta sp. AZ3]
MRRELVFVFNDFDEALTFMEMLTKRIKSRLLFIKYDVGRGVKVRVAVQGEPYEVELYSSEIRRIYDDIKAMRGRFNVKVYDMSILLNKARLKAAMPIDLIIDILRLMNINVELEGSKIKISGSVELNDVVSIIEDVSKLYGEMFDMDISAQAKRIVAIYSYIVRKTIKDSIDDLVKHGILRRYGTTELLVLSMKYEDALSKLKELIKTGEKLK